MGIQLNYCSVTKLSHHMFPAHHNSINWLPSHECVNRYMQFNKTTYKSFIRARESPSEYMLNMSICTHQEISTYLIPTPTGSVNYKLRPCITPRRVYVHCRKYEKLPHLLCLSHTFYFTNCYERHGWITLSKAWPAQRYALGIANRCIDALLVHTSRSWHIEL